MMKFSAHVILVLSLASGPATASPKSPPPLQLSDRQAAMLYIAKLDSFVTYFNTVIKTGVDVGTSFFADLPPKYRRQMRLEAAELGKVPKLERRENMLVLSYGPQELEIEYLDIQKNHVKIGGVHWTYDHSGGPSWQLRQFERAVERAGADRHAYWPSLLPEAEAQVVGLAELFATKVVKRTVGQRVGEALKGPVAKDLLKWGGVVVIAQGAFLNIICSGIGKVSDDPSSWLGTCTGWQEALDKKKSRDFKDTVANTESLAKTLQWVHSRDSIKCGNLDKDHPEAKQVVTAWIGEVPLKDTDKLRAKTWTYFKGVAVNRTLKEANIFKSPEDAESPKASEKALAHFTYSEDPNNPVTVQFPQKVEDVVTAVEAVEYPANTKVTGIADPLVRPRVVKMMYMAQTAQAWTKACFTDAFEAQFNREDESVKGNGATDSAK